MSRIKNIETALSIFAEAAIMQAKATEEGNYKLGNQCVKRLHKAVGFMKGVHALDGLSPFLSHSEIGVRLWAASYILSYSIDEKAGINVLEEISESDGIHALTASTTLNEWRKGKLRMDTDL